VQILQETSAYGVKFAEYRLMAATGQLLSFMGLEAPRQAGGYARDAFNVETWDGTEPERKPLDLTSFVN
jgi:adhesin transport system outer membrane protein